ncbi:MAG TPA: hypothetical protein PK760_00445 [Flavobacteriales bacterium]|nr:hypothetical protein [Flavobacteriales bacterium]
MNNDLSKEGGEGVVRSLDRAEVLVSTVEQLRKDLSLSNEELPQPAVGEEAFETLRTHVLEALERWTRTNTLAFSRAVNRVDLTERMVNNATDRGGLHELAGVMVIRCLQKVLSRHRYAGRF